MHRTPPMHKHWIAAALTVLAAQAQAQTPAEPTKIERVEVTGSLIKRIDRATPSVVQSITREDIRGSGYATIDELLRANSAVDASSIQDGAATGFVGGLSTISLRGFGSQGTLVLINGRRIAPVGAVDINFGRGTLLNTNTIPKGAIDRIDILKDGASALYGSDAMAGVVNYVLRKDFEGIEGNAGYSANDKGVGAQKTGGITFGFGNIDTNRFNVFGGVDVSKRDSVMHADLKDRGNQAAYDRYLNATAAGTTNGLNRFTPDSVASMYSSYYRVPASTAGTTPLDGRNVANSSPFGVNYLGTLPGCPADRTVGQGVATRPAGLAPNNPSLRPGEGQRHAARHLRRQPRPDGLCRRHAVQDQDDGKGHPAHADHRHLQHGHRAVGRHLAQAGRHFPAPAGHHPARGPSGQPDQRHGHRPAGAAHPPLRGRAGRRHLHAAVRPLPARH
jgi:iron complex outermembrane recepter protein